MLSAACIDKMAFVRGGDGAAFLGYEHSFFFGDLNYRVDMTYSYALSLLSKNVSRGWGEGGRGDGARTKATGRGRGRRGVGEGVGEGVGVGARACTPSPAQMHSLSTPCPPGPSSLPTPPPLPRSQRPLPSSLAPRPQDIAPLLSRDQLIKALPATVLRGFKESPLLFKPTYKYDKGTQVYDQSEKQRVPAWCDRILFNGAGLRALGYGRYEFTLSDHKPVWALFEAPVKTIDWTRAAATESSVRQTLTR